MFGYRSEFFMRKLMFISVLIFVLISAAALLLHRLSASRESTTVDNVSEVKAQTDESYSDGLSDVTGEADADHAGGLSDVKGHEDTGPACSVSASNASEDADGADRLRAQIEDNLYSADLALSEGEVSLEKLAETAGVLERTEEMLNELYMIQGVDEIQMEEYMTENLNMLSAIYSLMARRDPDRRRSYYDLAAGCIEKLFRYDKVRESSMYEPRLLDLVSIKEELGEDDEALKYLRNFEENNPQPGMDVYVAHACILLKDAGNGKEMKKLYEKMSDNNEFEENSRYAELRRQMEIYLAAEG